MSLDKSQILSATDSKIEPADVPEWGGGVHLRIMTGVERDAYESEMYQVKAGGELEVNRANVSARLLVRCICDPEGNRLFTDNDAEPLGRKNGNVLDRLFDQASRLNALRKSDKEDKVKNSGAGHSAGST